MKISRKDIIWSFLAQFFAIASGLIILPMVLNLLSAKEVGFYYILLAVGMFCSLIDLGFSPQFARNISFVFSGLQKLEKEGFEQRSDKETEINYALLAILIKTSRRVFSILATLTLFFVLSLGTWYVYHVTEGFSGIEYSGRIWFIFCLSVFFNIYYAYYNSFLTGAGMIKRAKQVQIISSLFKIVLTYVLLWQSWGLTGVVLANFLSPLLNRYLSYYFFFTPALKQKLKSFQVSISQQKEMFKTLWYNAKRGGLYTLSSFLSNQSLILLSGFFLSLEEIASFGLLHQLVGVLCLTASTVNNTYVPQYSFYLAKGLKSELQDKAAYAHIIYHGIFIIGSLILIFLGPFALQFIDSNSVLPSTGMIIFYLLVRWLDGNFNNFTQIYAAANSFPFLKDVLWTACFIILLCLAILAYTSLGLWGIILAVAVPQIVWNDWYWVKKVLIFLDISYAQFIKKGVHKIFAIIANQT